jgi:hypothetical protein
MKVTKPRRINRDGRNKSGHDDRIGGAPLTGSRPINGVKRSYRKRGGNSECNSDY